MATMKAAKTGIGRPRVGAERVTIMMLKGSPEYREWLSGLSKRTLIASTAIVRDALAKWARDRGSPEPPEL